MYRKRLKTVYELLEAGNNKKVIQEVDKLLASTSQAVASQIKPKKSPQQFQQTDGPVYDEESVQVVAKALKSLALVRTQRKQEADKLIDELLDSNTTDENALSIVMQYCKETQQLFKIVSFYENAVVKCENDPKLVRTAEHEEILSSLFYAHLRNRDFVKQQQVALKLYKQTNKMMFCFWNAASYVMMSKLDTPQLSVQQKGMYLQLGEKILQKAYEDQKMEYNGEFLLYLTILEERSKFEQALEIVNAFDEEKNGSKLGVTDFKVKKKIFYLKKLKKWFELRKVCELHLAHVSNANLDDWLKYLDHLDVLMELYTETNTKEDFVEGVLAFYKLLIDRIEIKKENELKDNAKAQGPYLARIEFLSRLFNLTNDSTTLISHFKEFFQAYIRMFASKPGFYFDLIYFKKLIAKLDLAEFILDELKKIHDANRPFKSVKSIYACLSYWQMNRFFGKQLNLASNELIQIAVDLEQMYKEALEFGKDLLPTSFQYADEFLIQAVHLRYDLYKREPNENNNMLQLIVNLKHGLIHSPSNYQLKLLLLNLYSHLGTYDSIQSMYDSMEIKNIQNYSTANLLLIHNIRLGALGSSYTTYTSMDQFFTSNLFDMANFLVYCFKYGTFLKALEIYSFMHTIGQSLTLNLCLTNTAAIQFIIHPLALQPVDQTEENDANEFKTLQLKLDHHIKEVANVSCVFDSNGLLPDDDTKLAELLLDHNDKNVLYQWEPEEQDQLAQEQYQLVLKEQRRLLRLRNIIVRFTDVMLKLWLSETPSSELTNKLNLYKTKLNEFNFEPMIKNEKEFDSKLKIYVTKSNYLTRWSELNLGQILNLVVNLSVDLCQNESFLDQEQQNNQKNLLLYRDQFKQASEMIKSKLETMINDLKNDFKIEKVAAVLESLTASLEALCYAIVVFTACLSSHKLKPIWSEKMKKSKKKKGAYAQYSQSIDLVYEIFEHLTNLVSFYSSQLKQNLCSHVSQLTQAQLNGLQTTIKLNYTPNLSDLAQSYTKSFDELKSNFNFKLKYLAKFAGQSAVFNQIMENLKLN